MLNHVPKFQVSDRVAFSAQWLINTAQRTGEIPFWRGTVKEVSPLGERTLVTIQWDHGEESKVIDANLAHIGPNVRFCNC